MAKFKWQSQEELERLALEAEVDQSKKENLEIELQTAPERISSLEEENMMLMMASAETYEQMYAENMNLMLAIAEMYELMMGGTV